MSSSSDSDDDSRADLLAHARLQLAGFSIVDREASVAGDGREDAVDRPLIDPLVTRPVILGGDDTLCDLLVKQSRSNDYYHSKLQEYCDLKGVKQYGCCVKLAKESCSGRIKVQMQTELKIRPRVGASKTESKVYVSMAFSQASSINLSFSEAKLLKDVMCYVAEKLDPSDRDPLDLDERLEMLEDVAEDPVHFLSCEFDYGRNLNASNFDNKDGFVESLRKECAFRGLLEQNYRLIGGDYELDQLGILLVNLVQDVHAKLRKRDGAAAAPSSETWTPPEFPDFVPTNPFPSKNIITEHNNCLELLNDEQKKQVPSVVGFVLQHFKLVPLSDDIENRDEVQSCKQRWLEMQPVMQCIASGRVFFTESVHKAAAMINDRLMRHLLECDDVDEVVKRGLMELKRKTDKTRESIRLNWNRSQPTVAMIEILVLVTGMSYHRTPIVLDFSSMIKTHQDALKFGFDQLGFPSNRGHKNHTPVSEIYSREGIQELIKELLQILSLGPTNSLRGKLSSLEYLVELFREKTAYTTNGEKVEGVDLHEFRHDLVAYYETRPLGKFIKCMFLFTMRYLQGGCVKCGCDLTKVEVPIADIVKNSPALVSCLKVARTPNGGYGEADHIERNQKEGGHKSMGLATCNVSKSTLLRQVNEWPHVANTCTECHNHAGVGAAYTNLSDSTFGEYESVEPRLFCDLQTCAASAVFDRTINGLISEVYASSLEFDTLTERISAAQEGHEPSYHVMDLLASDKEHWEDAADYTRRLMLRRARTVYRKRRVGGCYLCGKDFSAGPLRQLASLDAHHELEDKKVFGPATGIKKSIVEEDAEFCKCIPLCRPCHLFIHSNDVARTLLRLKLKEGGYVVDNDSGKISRNH